MKFSECDFYNLSEYNNPLIYFLLDNDGNVVYVGKSERGLARPFDHKYSKNYKDIMIKYVDKEKIDEKENYYIMKYKPIYNLKLNEKAIKSLQTIRRQLYYATLGISIRVDKIRKDLKEFKIQLNTLGKLEFITLEDYKILEEKAYAKYKKI